MGKKVAKAKRASFSRYLGRLLKKKLRCFLLILLYYIHTTVQTWTVSRFHIMFVKILFPHSQLQLQHPRHPHGQQTRQRSHDKIHSIIRQPILSHLHSRSPRHNLHSRTSRALHNFPRSAILHRHLTPRTQQRIQNRPRHSTRNQHDRDLRRDILEMWRKFAQRDMGSQD